MISFSNDAKCPPQYERGMGRRVRSIILGKFGINISIWATTHHPFPNPTLTLTVVELGEG